MTKNSGTAKLLVSSLGITVMIVKGLVGQFDAGRKNNRQVFFPFLQQLFGQPSLAAAATPFKIEKPSGPSAR